MDEEASAKCNKDGLAAEVHASAHQSAAMDHSMVQNNAMTIMRYLAMDAAMYALLNQAILASVSLQCALLLAVMAH